MKKVAVVGTGQTPYRTRHEEYTHPELVFEAVNNALKDAGISIEDVDAVVFGSMDPFDGVNQPERWCSTAVGLDKPLIKISTGGTTGITTALAAYQTVASGLFNIVLAVGVQRVGTSDDAQSIINTCVCPIYERHTGVGAITVGALQASRHMFKYGSTHEERAYIAVKDRKNAMKNPYAHLKMELTIEDVLNSRVVEWPLRLYECCPRSDGACAVIFASEDVAESITDRPAWVLGAVGISESYWWGDKPDLADWDSLEIAAKKLYRLARITNPVKEIDVAELYTAFTSQHILETEALGFCPKGKGGVYALDHFFDMDGELPTNPSGGVLSSNPIGVTGLVRVAEAASQVMGRAGEHQVKNVEVALAHAWGGTAQFHGLMLFGVDKTRRKEV